MKFNNNITPKLVLIVFLLSLFSGVFAQNQKTQQRKSSTQDGYKDGVYQPYNVIDTRIDNMTYWRKVAELGLVSVAPEVEVPKGNFKSTRIVARSVFRDDSPDIAVTDENSTQSENSIFVNPNDPDHVLQSNNSTSNPVTGLYGANYFFSEDFGETWDGSVFGAGGMNSGDPSTAIGLSGRQYVGYITSSGGMGISWSDNGTNWTPVVCSGMSSLDKNHLTIDNVASSPYEGNVYNSWVAFAGSNANEIEFTRSTNNGESYSSPINISSAVNAGGHNQGVNLATGPNGEVYATWAIYDGWPSDEDAIGFARSINGGLSFAPAIRAIDNIRGIRTSGTSKNQRVNSFPSMAVDCSNGPFSGNIYITWTNRGVPGVNSGSDIDIYLIISEDQGETWSAPAKINQDPSGLGSEHYFPWITCDPTNGALSAVFYDDRNVGGNKCETFCANSTDGGQTWEDFRVSDVDFTPSPIPGLAGDYMGDYLGIAAQDGKVYPVWTDNRDGVVMTYVSPYELNPLMAPSNLTLDLTFETGEVALNWQFETVAGFEYFVVYRDDFEVGTTTDLSFVDNLPLYGIYRYTVTAMHEEGESFGATDVLQWGDGHVAVNPSVIVENLQSNSTSTRYITIENVGELDLDYQVFSSTEPLKYDSKDYCIPSGNCTQNDGLMGFAFAEIDNLDNGCSSNGYGNFTGMSTAIEPGATYTVTLEAGYSNQNVSIWIDFDKSETFDASELLLIDYNLPSAGTYTTEITIPTGIPTGTTRMRVRAAWNALSSLDPCADINFGETEDYTIQVPGWMFMDIIAGTLAPGNTYTAEVNFNSEGLDDGSYSGNITVLSNDPDMPELDVPVTLNVGDLLPLDLQVIADPSTICAGESSQLHAMPSGGSGIYTYEWTSNPAGFTSNESDPMVNPMENTTYFVDVNDGQEVISGSTTVVVNPLPAAPATPQGESSLCFGEYQTVFSTNGIGGVSFYAWNIQPGSAGTISGSGLTATVTWDAGFIGSSEISVAGINDCGEGEMSEALTVTMNELPNVDLGEDISVCANESIVLDAGNPGATYLWSTGQTSQTIMVDTTGYGLGTAEFSVEVTSTQLCESSDTISIYFDDCTGVMEINESWSVDLSPNPSNGIFNIEIKALSEKPVDMIIMNTVGAIVYREESVFINQNSIKSLNLQSYPEGIYLFNVKGDGINIVKKLVIQK